MEDFLIDDFKRWSSYPYTVLRQDMGSSSDIIASLRAGAMARLGMSTGIAGLEWSDFVRPTRGIGSSFRRLDHATDEAAEFLRANGLVLDDEAGHAKNWIDAMRAQYP